MFLLELKVRGVSRK